MNKPSRRPSREARKQHKQRRREAQRQLRAQRVHAGVGPPRTASISNRLCPYRTMVEEQATREEAVASQVRVFRSLLPKRPVDGAVLSVPVAIHDRTAGRASALTVCTRVGAIASNRVGRLTI